MEPFYFGVLFFVMFSMLIVNLILFYRVLLADSYITSNGIQCVLTPWHWVPIEVRMSNIFHVLRDIKITLISVDSLPRRASCRRSRGGRRRPRTYLPRRRERAPRLFTL